MANVKRSLTRHHGVILSISQHHIGIQNAASHNFIHFIHDTDQEISHNTLLGKCYEQNRFVTQFN